jgi:ferredoxin-NADP reductase
MSSLLSGPAKMMEIARDAMAAAGVPAKSIRYERFDYAVGKGHLDKARRRERSSLPYPAGGGGCIQPSLAAHRTRSAQPDEGLFMLE